MPILPRKRGDVLTWALLTVVLLGCGGSPKSAAAPDGLAEKIHKYLGNNSQPDPKDWEGLTGNIMENNKFLRDKLTDLECRLWKLENPGKPEPTPCPPGGPPSTRPTDPPRYP
jgi:hypothetical protein